MCSMSSISLKFLCTKKVGKSCLSLYKINSVNGGKINLYIVSINQYLSSHFGEFKQ